MKRKYLIAIAVIIIVVALFIAATNSSEYWKTISMGDAKVDTIAINKTIIQGNISFEIDRIELGDKYSTIYYVMAPFTAGEMLKGAQLFKDGSLLKVLRYPYSEIDGGAICFEPVDSVDNLIFTIEKVSDYEVNDYDYRLEFKDGLASLDSVIDDKEFNVSVKATGQGMELELSGLSELSQSDTSTRLGVPITCELFSEDTGEFGGIHFDKSKLPTHMRITYTKCICSDETIEIPIS